MIGLGSRIEKLERLNGGNQRPIDSAEIGAFLERCLDGEEEVEMTPADLEWVNRVFAALDAAEAEWRASRGHHPDAV